MVAIGIHVSEVAKEALGWDVGVVGEIFKVLVEGEWKWLGVQHGDGVLEGWWGQGWGEGVVGLGGVGDGSGEIGRAHV